LGGPGSARVMFNEKVRIALEIIRAARKAGLDLRIERNRSSLSVNDALTVDGVRLNALNFQSKELDAIQTALQTEIDHVDAV
jgi:hypothetical protein